MDCSIQVTELHKSYGAVHAVNGISFYAESGKLLAFLGPNGAGKSTTIDIICTFLKPDSGSVKVNDYSLGKEDNEIRQSIGAVFQDGLLDARLTVEENLRVRGAFYGLKGKELTAAVKNALITVNMEDLSKRQYGKLSGGQRRRCDIARALVHTPKVLFLDEPTTGLDPQTRKAVWDTILKLQRETGMTVFLTTHYMEEAAEADYVIVIDNGLIAAKGTPAELREKYANDKLTLIGTDPAIQSLLEAEKLPYSHSGDHYMVNLESTLEALPIIEKCKPYITGFEVSTGTMDDAFIGITGKEMRE
jgi:multidrug/hemolysin transport system ATP-binding protein